MTPKQCKRCARFLKARERFQYDDHGDGQYVEGGSEVCARCVESAAWASRHNEDLPRVRVTCVLCPQREYDYFAKCPNESKLEHRRELEEWGYPLSDAERRWFVEGPRWRAENAEADRSIEAMDLFERRTRHVSPNDFPAFPD